jgi:hypothetical protein
VVDGLLRFLVLPAGPGIDSPHGTAQILLVDVVAQLLHSNLSVRFGLQQMQQYLILKIICFFMRFKKYLLLI